MATVLIHFVLLSFAFTSTVLAALDHYGDVIMGTMASQITSLTIVYSTAWPGADQRKPQSSTLLAFVWGIHRWPVNSPHKWQVTRKMVPFYDVIMVRHYNAFLYCYAFVNVMWNTHSNFRIIAIKCKYLVQDLERRNGFSLFRLHYKYSACTVFVGINSNENLLRNSISFFMYEMYSKDF